ncbi:hypothetical protein HW555_002666 [Spodoptera exigua]|uniref:Uncharacterized protein n=1 Tax=Spodoptera exigua TaxID=7107 RepID=A0A835GQX6_SPOEX|nr:hypothetical protein HW555_002666 [Spodoptera exigua]
MLKQAQYNLQTDPIKMRVYTIVFALLVAFVASMAAENGPLMAALQPVPVDDTEVMVVQPQGVREKRSALLGAGLIGAGALGLGAAGLESIPRRRTLVLSQTTDCYAIPDYLSVRDYEWSVLVQINKTET